MFKKYWLEMAVTLGMTAMLASSFTTTSPQPYSTPQRQQARDDYRPAREDAVFFEADYQPGSHNPDRFKPWTLKLKGDGSWQGHTQGKLTPAQLNRLLARLRRELLLEMRERTRFVVDPKQPLLTLRLHLTGGEAEMKVPLTSQVKGQADGRRFLRVWADLVTEIPTPNGEKPMLYLGEVGPEKRD